MGKSSRINKLISKAFLTNHYFTVALRKKTADTAVPPCTFHADYVVPAKWDVWPADPMLVADGGKTYLFYESLINEKGRIEVAEVRDDATLSAPTVILEDACHHSYPFVFRQNDTWYMIPEACGDNEVNLYKATRFPDQWEQVTTLLRDYLVDTTVFDYHGQTILLTFQPFKTNERVMPYAYRLSLQNDTAALEPLAWEHYDTLRVRGAGGVLCRNEEYYRPAQISRETLYGDGVAFYKIRIEGNRYCEEEVSFLTADEITLPVKIWYDGLHTYSSTDKFEAIDLRCHDFSLLKLPKKLLSRFKKH